MGENHKKGHASKKESTRFYRLRLLRDRIRHGMFLYSVRNLLTRFGLDIAPYFWVLEGKETIPAPMVRGMDQSKLKLSYLDIEDVKKISILSSGANLEENVKNFKNGQKCIGLWDEKEIAAYMFIEFNDFVYQGRTFQLKPNEAYLLNMYTFDSYRGKNIAPFLRFESYRLLKEQGVDTTYSITNYFNTASIRFKKKLKAKNIKLYMYIKLFKRFQWNILLKSYG